MPYLLKLCDVTVMLLLNTVLCMVAETGGDHWHACHIRDDDYCFIHFAYNYSSDEVKVQRTKGEK